MPVVEIFFIFFRNITCDTKMNPILFTFLDGGVDHNSGHPAFETAFPGVLINSLKDLDKAILEEIFCLLIIPGILKAEHEKLFRIIPVKLFLRLSVLLFTEPN